MNETITVEYGVGNERQWNVFPGMTIGSVIKDSNLQALLGYGDNVAGHICGVAQPENTPLFDGNTLRFRRLTIHDRQQEKRQ